QPPPQLRAQRGGLFGRARRAHGGALPRAALAGPSGLARRRQRPHAADEAARRHRAPLLAAPLIPAPDPDRASVEIITTLTRNSSGYLSGLYLMRRGREASSPRRFFLSASYSW